MLLKNLCKFEIRTFGFIIKKSPTITIQKNLNVYSTCYIFALFVPCLCFVCSDDAPFGAGTVHSSCLYSACIECTASAWCVIKTVITTVGDTIRSVSLKLLGQKNMT